MNTRRAFLQHLAILAAGLAVDPERVLWTPKAMITVPAMPWLRVDWAVGADMTLIRRLHVSEELIRQLHAATCKRLAL